ncbi:hypothetical protein J3E69DRAFT_342398 [Trichoderma sp. SZMC 28015]
MIERWLHSRNRPQFAFLLDFDRRLENPGLLSNYLGFPKLEHFYYFVDFIGGF